VVRRVTTTSGVFSVETHGDGPPLLLVHGFPLNRRMWAGQLGGALAGFRVFAPDLRGFGQSAAAGETTLMSDFADDLAELLDATHVGQPVVFCGLSMGGYIGWQFWRRHRAKLAALIQCDTRAAADSKDVALARKMMANTVLKSGMDRVPNDMLPKLLAPETLQRRQDIARRIKEMILSADRQGVAAAQRGMAQRPDVTEWLKNIDVPTLLLCGEHDAISPPSEMRAIAEQIPDARFVEIPHAGHMAPMENAAAVNEAIANF